MCNLNNEFSVVLTFYVSEQGFNVMWDVVTIFFKSNWNCSNWKIYILHFYIV